jgi:hypothetical protein
MLMIVTSDRASDVADNVFRTGTARHYGKSDCSVLIYKVICQAMVPGPNTLVTVCNLKLQ